LVAESSGCDLPCTHEIYAFSALTLLVGRQEGHPAWWGAGVVVCLEQDADLHMAQLMPLPLTVSCFSEIQIGFTFLVPAYLCSLSGKGPSNGCVCCSNEIMSKCSELMNMHEYYSVTKVGESAPRSA